MQKILKKWTFESDSTGGFLYKIIKYTILSLRFLYRNIFYQRFLLNYIYRYFDKSYILNNKELSEYEIEKYIKDGKSIVRLGDGEFAMMRGMSIHYQDYKKDIATALWNLVKEYNKKSTYILGVNNIILKKTNKYLKENNQFRMWLPTKIFYDLYFNKNVKTFELTIFYNGGYFKNKILPIIKNKKLIIITKIDTINDIKNNLSNDFIINKDIFFIETSSSNAFNKYENIKEEIKNITFTNPDKFILLPACGPLSKLIAFEYLNKIQTLDIGKGMEIAFNNKTLENEVLK